MTKNHALTRKSGGYRQGHRFVKRLALATSTALCLMHPGASQAASFASTLASQNGSTVQDVGCSAGYCTVTNTPVGMLTNSQVQSFQDNWVKEVNTMGESITAVQQSQTTAMGNAMSTAAKNFNTMLKSLIPSLLSEGYAAPKAVPHISPLSGCSAPAISKQLSEGSTNVAATREVFNQLDSQYNNSTVSHAAAVQRVAQAPASSLLPDTILPPPLTASAAYPKAADVSNYVTMLTNPLPAVQLTSGQKKTSAGVQWKAALHAQQNEQTLAQNALNWLAGDTQPTMDAAPFQTLWKASKMPGPMPGVAASAPGMSGPAISLNASLQAVANSFYANPQFETGITQATQVELMDHAAMLLNVASEQDDRSLMALQYWSAILANRYMDMIRATRLDGINQTVGQSRMQEVAN